MTPSSARISAGASSCRSGRCTFSSRGQDAPSPQQLRKRIPSKMFIRANSESSAFRSARPNRTNLSQQSRGVTIPRAVAVAHNNPFADLFPGTSTGVGEDLGWPTNFKGLYALNEYKVLGQGSFGIVHEGTDLISGDTVAVKIMPKARANVLKEGNLIKLAREIGVMEQLQGCRNVVGLGGYFEDRENVQIVMELCSGPDLQKIVESYGTLSERALAMVAAELVTIIGACHQSGILHADVKPANFILSHPINNPLFSNSKVHAQSAWLKALDFGCSQSLKGDERLFKRTGTPVYIAPEVFARNYGFAADMWSFGVTLYWLYAERFPFFPETAIRAAKLDDVINAVANAPIPYDYHPWKELSPEGLDFIQRCLERDEHKRMTIQMALEHPWLQDAFAITGKECFK
eukprot:gene28402-31538_t